MNVKPFISSLSLSHSLLCSAVASASSSGFAQHFRSSYPAESALVWTVCTGQTMNSFRGFGGILRTDWITLQYQWNALETSEISSHLISAHNIQILLQIFRPPWGLRQTTWPVEEVGNQYRPIHVESHTMWKIKKNRWLVWATRGPGWWGVKGWDIEKLQKPFKPCCVLANARTTNVRWILCAARRAVFLLFR